MRVFTAGEASPEELNGQLFHVGETGNTAAAQRALSLGASANVEGENGLTPLGMRCLVEAAGVELWSDVDFKQVIDFLRRSGHFGCWEHCFQVPIRYAGFSATKPQLLDRDSL